MRSILVIGGGPAGTMAAIAAKKHDPTAHVRLLTRERCEPYEKPPLSKGVLLGQAAPEDAPIAGPGLVASHGVVLDTGAHATAIDRLEHTVALEDGRRMGYDTVVVATGSTPREIPQLPIGMPRVRYLRTDTDARVLQADLRRSRDLLVLGGGLIGLEVAASAAMLGVRTIVLEIAPRILARVCDEQTAASVHAAHVRHDVDIRVGTPLSEAAVESDGRIRVVTSSGDHLIADLVVVGTGSKPDDDLAARSGLVTEDGIVVDAQCRTSDHAVYAAGDAVCFPGPHGMVRLENWHHAQDQGLVAGRNAAGATDNYAPVPSFWSEQYDLYIQGVGWPAPGSTRVHRRLGEDNVLVFEVSDGRLTHAMGINVQRDLSAARRLIERRIPVDPLALADPAQPLAAMLKR